MKKSWRKDIVTGLRWIVADWLLRAFISVAPDDELKRGFIQALYPWAKNQIEMARRYKANAKLKQMLDEVFK